MKYRFNSITRNNDFSRAYARGKSYVHPLLVMYINKNRAQKTRVGITTSKKIGNAVVRSRARRVIRVAMRAVLPAYIGNKDIVFVARVQTAKVKSGTVTKAMQKLLTDAGVLNNNA